MNQVHPAGTEGLVHVKKKATMQARRLYQSAHLAATNRTKGCGHHATQDVLQDHSRHAHKEAPECKTLKRDRTILLAQQL